mmetsp:Transcript_4561/g.5490  ORF Transcript_4561/g.5490 Transcript_4561/m.5490 type:complete len:249 (-) Transcript_4561:90-836(-)|eukprot:CAMPEP_0195269944 /NCGR_PEP_ID=MMETSP0706-20130129/14064_1 /TAXON_ID=33640 /ORGANISM="Asterionellopsis glacialis, Strain CCMP134" /LENGTH=248 /DNA_ID=CAMNT_0040325137 /DNA_START=56 /DNA_END=802 /DNA_ORIENTATION=-
MKTSICIFSVAAVLLASGTHAFVVPSACPYYSPSLMTTKTTASADTTATVVLQMSENDEDSDLPTTTTTTKKETTWDRITGPKLFKTVTNWNGIHSVPLVPLRIVTGLLMIHHGSEGGVGPANFGTPEFQGFIDYIITPYFGFLPGPPELWSALHDYVEFGGGILFALGFLTRPASLALLGTMMSAVYFHLSSVGLQGFPFGHVSNYSYDFEEPMLYTLIFLMFWFNGAGPLSIDSIIYKSISQEEEE